MEFGIFDHVDRSDLPLHEFYEQRLKLIEAYDQAGFRTYHCAEHHSTPLGMSPSPSVYLAAVAARTKRLRFGPLVYTLALYHPLRLAEEICMLDQMSRGRLDVGVGKGISPIEVGFYGVDHAKADRMFTEALRILLQGLTEQAVNFEGRFFRFENVPMELQPMQRPHPPLWRGIATAESAERAARSGDNVVSLSSASQTRSLAERYRQTWRAMHDDRPLPRIGLGRFIVVAQSDEAALRLARRAYVKWHASFHHLWHRHGLSPTRGERAPRFDEIRNGDRGIAGSPPSVIAALSAQLAESGANYCVGQFAFGDMTLDEAQGSVELFVRQVMPAVRASFA